MSLEDRQFIEATALESELEETKIGAFLAFVTLDDAHSPVMLPVYDTLFEYAEGQVPLLLIDCRLEQNEPLLQRYLIYSVPTLIWANREAEPLMRLIGTVMDKKLRDEFDQALEIVLA